MCIHMHRDTHRDDVEITMTSPRRHWNVLDRGATIHYPLKMAERFNFAVVNDDD